MMRKNRLKENRGFTLAELLLVVAIIAIVAAIGILAIGNERKNKTAMAYDDTARQIYLLAQNRLLQMKEYGEWEAFQKEHPYEQTGDEEPPTEEDIVTYYGLPIAGKPSDYSYWKTETGYDRDFITSEAAMEDEPYMRVLSAKELQENGKGELLKKLLPAGSLEDGVRNYLIEYNVKTAAVYGVFYSEGDFDLDGLSAKGEYYGDGLDVNANARYVGDKTKARNRRKNYSESTVMGYFGGGMVSELTYADVPMPEVIVYNGEDLVLYIENKYISPNAEDQQFNFDDSECTVMIKGTASGAAREYRIIADETAPGGYSLEPIGNPNLPKLDLIKKVERGAGDPDPNGYPDYAIVLDSYAEVNGTGTWNERFHFGENFCNEITLAPKLYPGEDLEITVKVTQKDTIGLPGVRTVKTNSLFASVGEADSETVGEDLSATKMVKGGIEISAIRHLMNLSRVDLAQTYSGDRLLFPSDDVHRRRAYLSSNISFDRKGEDLRPYTELAARDYKTTGVSYEPVRLVLNDTVQEFYLSGKEDDGDSAAEAFRIYDLSIDGADGDTGLFGSITTETETVVPEEEPLKALVISNLGIVRASDSTANETCIGIAADASGSVNAGAFVGSAACDVTIENCYSTVLLQAVSSDITAANANKYNIGGLTGSVGGNLTVRNSYVSGRTEGGKYAPMAGLDGGNYYNIGFHTGGVNTETNVGGLAGSVGGTLNIASSYCVASIGNRDNNGYNNDMKAGAYNIGGLVGKTDKNCDLTIDNSYFYAYADIPDIEKLAGNEVNIRLGGLIGNRDGSGSGACSVTNSSYIEEYLFISDVVKTENGEPATLSGGDAVGADTDLVIDGDFKTDSDAIEAYRYTYSFTDEGDEDSFGTPIVLRESVYPGMVPCGSISAAEQSESFKTVPYDSALITLVEEEESVDYPYPDVTGLNHHFGDWSQELPASMITLEAGIGTAGLGQPEDVTITNGENTITLSWAQVNVGGNDIPGKWYIDDVPAGTELDVAALISGKMTLKSGYQGLACSRSYSRISKNNTTDWTYTTKGMDAVITLNAAEIVPLVLSCPDESEANTTDAATEYPVSGRRYESGATGNGNYRRVFGYQDVPMEIQLMSLDSESAVPQGYDPDITLCFTWAEKDEKETEYVSQVSNPAAAASYNDMCIVTDVNNPVCYYYANKKQAGEANSPVSGANPSITMSMDQFVAVNDATFAPPEGQSGSTDDVGKYIPVIKKKAYYGNRQYQLRAYAFVTQKEGTDVSPVAWLRTSLSAPLELSAALDRVPVSFVYDDDDTIESSVTAAENIFGKYEIKIKNSQGIEYSIPDDDTQVATFYMEYEDDEEYEDDDSKKRLRLFENNGVMDDERSSYVYTDENDEKHDDQQAVADSVPFAVFFDPKRPQAEVIFRGWQDAGKPVGYTYTDQEKPYTDWNWDEFKHEMSGRYYGPDVWYDDNNGTGVPDGTEMLVFELEEGKELITAHGGVKDYLVETDGNCYFRPERPDPIQLKARWWRVPVEVGGDPNGGYY